MCFQSQYRKLKAHHIQWKIEVLELRALVLYVQAFGQGLSSTVEGVLRKWIGAPTKGLPHWIKLIEKMSLTQGSPNKWILCQLKWDFLNVINAYAWVGICTQVTWGEGHMQCSHQTKAHILSTVLVKRNHSTFLVMPLSLVSFLLLSKGKLLFVHWQHNFCL